MVKSLPFTLENEESLITLPVTFFIFGKRQNLNLALDTGASHTVVDFNILYRRGLKIDHAIRTVKMQTAGGVIEGFIFKIESISVLGKEMEGFEICCYDFLQFGQPDLYRGMLGLDFFRQTRLGIDFIDWKLKLKTN